MNEKHFNLSEKENNSLIRLEKNVKNIRVFYLSVGIALCTAIMGLFIGIIQGRQEGFIIALLFGAIGINLYFLSSSYHNLFKIIKKMRDHIQLLEQQKET